MPDNGQIEGLPEGAVVKPLPSNQIEGLPEGAVVKPIGDQSTETVQPPPPMPKTPDMETSTLGAVGEPIARGVENAGQALGYGSLGNTNEEVKKKLIEIARHPVDQATQFAKGVLDQQGELAYKAKDAWQKGDYAGAAAHALYYLMPGIGPTLDKAGEQIKSGDVAGGVGTTVGAAAPMLVDAAMPTSEVPKTGFKAAADAQSREAAVKLPAKTATAEETTAQAKPLKEAGERVQTEAKAVRDTKGKAVAAAKTSVEKSLPEGQKPFPKDGALAKASKSVLDDTADTEQLAGAKDPDIAEVRGMADHLSKGQNAKGEPLSADPTQADSIKRAFDQKIATLEGKVAQGGNATALKHVKALKTAFNDDLFDSYEKYGDPEAAKALRSANKDYAQTVADQTQGPAKTSLKTQSPEKIVSNIVSGGAKSQSAVESLLKNSSKEGNAALRDSTLKEIYRRTSAKTADGNIDMNAARQKFNAMGDAGKKLFGEKYDETKQFLDAAAKEQVRRTEAANKPSVGKTIVTKSLKAVGAAEGASLAGVPGAVAGYAAGEAVGDAIYQQGKSGAVKIGISPTERIVLSPADAVSKRPLITKFLNAKSAGKTAAMTSAYNAIAGKPEKDDIESAIDNSDGSKESQDSIFQKIIAFNKASKTMDDDTKARIQKKITDYNNSLVRKNYK